MDAVFCCPKQLSRRSAVVDYVHPFDILTDLERPRLLPLLEGRAP
jgi:hypothetical protein